MPSAVPVVGADQELGHVVEGLKRELEAARRRESATADVLKAIRRGPLDLDNTLATLIETAVTLCDADLGVLRRRIGDAFPVAACHGWRPEWQGLLARHETAPGRDSTNGRAALTGTTVHIPDVLADPEFNNPAHLESQRIVGYRTD